MARTWAQHSDPGALWSLPSEDAVPGAHTGGMGLVKVTGGGRREAFSGEEGGGRAENAGEFGKLVQGTFLNCHLLKNLNSWGVITITAAILDFDLDSELFQTS